MFLHFTAIDAPGVGQGSTVFSRIQERIAASAGLQHGRLILWAPVVFALGIGGYFALPAEPPAWGLWAIGAAVAGAVALSARLWRKGAVAHAFALICALLALAAAGFGAGQLRTASLGTIMLDRQMKAVRLEGRVQAVERLAPGEGARIVLDGVTIEGLSPEKAPGRIRLRLRTELPPAPGTDLSTLAGLSPPAPPVFPGAYDFARDAYFKGIGASGFVYGKAKSRFPLTEREASSDSSPQGGALPAAGGWIQEIAFFLETLRQRIVGQAEKYLDPPVAGMVATYLTGEGSTISEADWQAMRVAGLAHLLAISGMNIGIVAGIVFFVTRLAMAAVPPLALRWPIKKLAAVFAFFAALAYMFLVGAQVPAQRAMLMTGMALFAILIDRSPFSMRLLCASALVVLALRPESLFGASFQMSYAAVGALIFAWDAGRKILSDLYTQAGAFRRAGLYFAGVCATTVIATLATAPFSLFHFQQLSTYGLVANLIGVPVMSFIIMPGAMLAYLLMPLGIGEIPLRIVAFGVEITLKVAHAVAALPGAALEIPAWPMAGLVLVVLGAVWFMLWQGWGKTLALVPLAGAALLVAWTPLPDVMVSHSGKLIAVRAGPALYASTGRSDRFDRGIWLRRLGMDEDAVRSWPKEGVEAFADGTGSIACDPAACRILLKGRKLAHVRKPEALAQECAWAEIVLADFPRRNWRCKAPRTVWLWSVPAKTGALAIILPDDPSQALAVETTAEQRGDRPWSRRHSDTPAQTDLRPLTRSE